LSFAQGCAQQNQIFDVSWIGIGLIKEFDVNKFVISKAGRERIERCQREDLCCACEQRFDESDVVRQSCGMCQTCYNAARNAIRNGTETQANLVRLGQMLKPHSQTRRAKNRFTQALASKQSSLQQGKQ